MAIGSTTRTCRTKVTVAMQAVGDKIRLNSQGWEDARVLTERQVAMVVAYKGQHYLGAASISIGVPAGFEPLAGSPMRIVE